MQERIGNIELDYTYYPGEDIYSDGPIEDELLEIAKSCTESELNAEIARRKLAGAVSFFPYPPEYSGVGAVPENRQSSGDWFGLRRHHGCHRTEGWIRYLYRSFQKEKLYQCLQKPCI